ncbi:hypothetical protein C492_15431 [Natronococcus jeotgali DSM 18795]|uniref:Uncharacterized protein n=1 Tax=Natronococcus jeotgali DSM 18795 TaxID=1227498 RepID=L9X1M8_9EURY|nr:hypothetical protein C492_15431 [Natronococcus jeotgali DSM 18795]
MRGRTAVRRCRRRRRSGRRAGIGRSRIGAGVVSAARGGGPRFDRPTTGPTVRRSSIDRRLRRTGLLLRY